MDKRLDELQKRYIDDLRSIVPEIEAWWHDCTVRNVMKGHAKGISIDFDTRWPAGKSSHPRILAVFRRYFLEAEATNAIIYDEFKSGGVDGKEGEWGIDTPRPALEQVLPVDLLIEDIEDEAPDLFEFVEGLVFVPIGDDDAGSLG